MLLEKGEKKKEKGKKRKMKRQRVNFVRIMPDQTFNKDNSGLVGIHPDGKDPQKPGKPQVWSQNERNLARECT